MLMDRFKRMKLATKLAAIIGAVLACNLAMLTIISVAIADSEIGKGVTGELTAIAERNADTIENSFNTLEDSAAIIQQYMNSHKNGTGDKEFNSSIYDGVSLSLQEYNEEEFITELSRSTVKGNSEVSAFGVMFEPYMFSSDIETYGFFIMDNNADSKIDPFMSYEDYSVEDSYRYVIESGKTYISQPYESDDKTVIAYGTPIIVDNEIVGAAIGNIDLSVFHDVTTSSENYQSMWVTITDSESNIIWDSSSSDSIGDNIISDMIQEDSSRSELRDSLEKGKNFSLNMKRMDGTDTEVYCSPVKLGDTTWWSMTGLFASDAQRAVVTTGMWMGIASFVVLAIVIAVIVSIIHRILRPIRSVVTAADALATGNFDVAVSAKTSDEIGYMANIFGSMAETLKFIIGDVSTILQKLGNGNLIVESRDADKYVGEFRGILSAVDRIRKIMRSAMHSINESSEQASEGASQVSGGAQALSQGATEQAAAIQELASTVEQISYTAKSNSKMSIDAYRDLLKVNGEVQKSGDKVSQMYKTMERIHENAKQIRGIIKTIEDIAFQTNILALNAAVEAARAGDSGKGFSVVADEVRSLAGKSAEASKETANLIGGAAEEIEKIAADMSETKEFMEYVVKQSSEITDVFKKIADASDEQAIAISQVSDGVEQISSVVQTNSATAEESAAASEELYGQAQTLQDLVGRFKLS